MPVDEMTRGIHNYIWPLELPNNHLSASVMRACQALALDEERTTFHPQLWDETAGTNGGDRRSADPARKRFIKDERISQVWFAGVHTNVGGGYPDDALAYIPFVWMITEARRCGLKFKSDYANEPPNPDVMRADPDTFKNAISKRDKDGRLYDPRKGLGGYYRYGPRKLVPAFYRSQETGRGRGRRRSAPRFTRACSGASKTMRMPTRRSACRHIIDVVKEDGEIVSPDTVQHRARHGAVRDQRRRGATRAGAGACLELGLEAPHRLFRHRRRDAVAGGVPAGQQRATLR